MVLSYIDIYTLYMFFAGLVVFDVRLAIRMERRDGCGGVTAMMTCC